MTTKRWPTVLAHVFLISLGILWLVPLVGMVFSSFRPYSETSVDGFFSWPNTLTWDNFEDAWARGNMGRHFWITLVVVVPAVIITLVFASMVAFAVSRFSWRFNIALLMLFTAGNLLPPQAIIQPLFQMYLRIPMPEIPLISESGELRGSLIGLVLINVAFQSGFCTFVLANYMKTLPKELNEAAMVDGASVWRQYWQIVLPLTRPALAALATLEFAWIYNDYFWAVIFEQRGDDRPITSALSNLGGEFVTDTNVVSAASVFVIIPVMIVYFALQKHFIAGLTLGSTKG